MSFIPAFANRKTKVSYNVVYISLGTLTKIIFSNSFNYISPFLLDSETKFLDLISSITARPALQERGLAE